jgi:hypothetical protein
MSVLEEIYCGILPQFRIPQRVLATQPDLQGWLVAPRKHRLSVQGDP